MAVSVPLLILILIVLFLAIGGWGYGYYTGGAYASPLGIILALLLIGLVAWLLAGPMWTTGPPP
jgi:hypothetical protein